MLRAQNASQKVSVKRARGAAFFLRVFVCALAFFFGGFFGRAPLPHGALLVAQEIPGAAQQPAQNNSQNNSGAAASSDAPAPSSGDVLFANKYKDADKYTVLSVNRQTIDINGDVVSQDVELRNHISFEIKDRAEDSLSIAQNTEFTEQGKLRFEEKSEFTLYADGRMDVPAEYRTPLIRGIPRFETQKLAQGYVWKKPGTDVIQIPSAATFLPVAVEVTYQYTGAQKLPAMAVFLSKGVSNAPVSAAQFPVFRATYSIAGAAYTDVRRGEEWHVNGVFLITVWWNAEAGRPEFSSDEYEIAITNRTRQSTEKYSGTSFTRIIPVAALAKDDEVESIRSELKSAVPEAEVSSTEKGITINLPNVQFLSDSAELTQDERKKLDAVAAVLQKYPDRRVLIEGHTALAGTPASRKQLSEQRAKAVKEYLERKSPASREMLFRGWGAEKPVAPNTDEESRAKNRRVEVTILEN